MQVKVDAPMPSLKKYFFDSCGVGKSARKQNSSAAWSIYYVGPVSDACSAAHCNGRGAMLIFCCGACFFTGFAPHCVEGLRRYCRVLCHGDGGMVHEN